MEERETKRETVISAIAVIAVVVGTAIIILILVVTDQ